MVVEFYRKGGACHIHEKLEVEKIWERGAALIFRLQSFETEMLAEIERQQKLGKEVVFRADAAFAKPETYGESEERGVKYAIRIPANESLERNTAELLTRPVGRPTHKPAPWYSCRYRINRGGTS